MSRLAEEFQQFLVVSGAGQGQVCLPQILFPSCQPPMSLGSQNCHPACGSNEKKNLAKSGGNNLFLCVVFNFSGLILWSCTGLLNGFLYYIPREGQLGVKRSGDTREIRLPKEVRQKGGNLEPAAQVRIPPSSVSRGLLPWVRSAPASSSNR